MKTNALQHESKAPFYIILLYLFLEFGRPQNLVPALASVHLPALTIVLILVSLLVTGKTKVTSRITIMLLLILLEMLIHGPIAINNYWAFWVFYGMVINFIAYFGIAQFIDTEQKFDKFLDFYFLIFIYLSIYGFIYHGRGVGGFLGDENDFCMVLNMVFPFALYSVFSAKSNSRKLFYISLSVLFLVANITTLSRGGFLGLASVIFYCTVRSKNKFAIVSLTVLLVFFALLFAPETYWNEIRSIQGEGSNTQGTGAQRLYAWGIGWEIFKENPIMGVGQGNYPWHVVDTENRLGVQWIERSLGGRAAHSLYFTLLPELGSVGVILFVVLIVYILKDIKYIKTVSKKFKYIFTEEESKKHYNMALAFEASLIGFLVSSVFISTLYYPSLYILCGIVVAYNNIIKNRVLLSGVPIGKEKKKHQWVGMT